MTVHSFKPRMRPVLRRRNGEILLVVMGEDGVMVGHVLCERDMNELALSASIINQEVAKERISAAKA